MVVPMDKAITFFNSKTTKPKAEPGMAQMVSA